MTTAVPVSDPVIGTLDKKHVVPPIKTLPLRLDPVWVIVPAMDPLSP